MDRSRAFRRHQLLRSKAKAARLARWWLRFGAEHGGMVRLGTKWVPREEWIQGWIVRMASTHCKPCSCVGCGNPRKHFGRLTRKELMATLAQTE